MKKQYKAVICGASTVLILFFIESGTVQQSWFKYIRGNTVTSGNIKVELSESWYPTHNTSNNIFSLIYRSVNDNYPEHTSIYFTKLNCSKEKKCSINIDFLPNHMANKIERKISDKNYYHSPIGKIFQITEWENRSGDIQKMYYIKKTGITLTVKDESNLKAIKAINNNM